MSVRIGSAEVGSIGLGTASFAFKDISEQQAYDTVEAALDAGIVLIDTALAYSRRGVESYSEEVVGKALARISGEKAFVVTKGGHWRDGDEFPVDGRPETLKRHCEISLRNLGRESLDLYLLHHVDPEVPLEESVGALQELRESGAVRSVGLSNVSAGQLDRALAVGPIAAVQNRLSIAHPGDVEFANQCAQLSIAYLAYQPLDNGADAPDAVSRVARRLGASPQQVMLAWVMGQGLNVLPIVGASRPESVRDSALGAQLVLSATDLEELER